MQIFTLIPLGTQLLILVLSITTIAFIFLRISLYRELKRTNSRTSRLLLANDKEGIQPPIINRLRERYQKASQSLEQVNTAALIDNIYKEETISFVNVKIQYDQAEGFTKVWPNLLIAFGLIGTFWGITHNLNNISAALATLNQGDLDISRLLKSPLQDMGIAFSSSLAGILLGSALTVTNTFWNTNIAKCQLIANLEDYLDNIYKINTEGNTRLDKAIDRMVQQQQEFLLRFHDNVGRALESSFGKAANQIAEECGRINKIAEHIYTNFSNAAGTISTGANTFEIAAKSMQAQNVNLTNSLNNFTNGVIIFRSTVERLEKNNIIQNIDRVLLELNTTQASFSHSAQMMQNSLNGITTSNETATKLAQSVYETWQASTDKIDVASTIIKDGADLFQQATTSWQGQTQALAELVPAFQAGVGDFAAAADQVKENNIIKNLDEIVTTLSTTQQSFSKSTKSLVTGNNKMIANNQEATELAHQIYKSLGNTTASLQDGANKFSSAAQIIHTSSLAIELMAAAKEWQIAQADFTKSTNSFSQSAQQIQPISANLQPTIIAINRSVDTIQKFGNEVVSFGANTLEVSKPTAMAIDNIDRQNQIILNAMQSSMQSLVQTNQLSWQELQNTLKHQTTTGQNFNEQLVRHMKEYLTQSTLKDRDYSMRIMAMLEKLEIKVDGNNMVGNISN